LGLQEIVANRDLRLVVMDVLKSGITMQSLATLMGVSDRQVHHWKAGQQRPTGIVAVRLFEFRRGIVLHTEGITVHSHIDG
jgi:predicted transcriptional regulator